MTQQGVYMEKEPKKILNLEEKIYFLTFVKPRYKTEISKMIYGKEVKQIFPLINKLKKHTQIKETIVPIKQQEIKHEGDRAKARNYLKANPEPLVEEFCKKLEDKTQASLTKKEKDKLKRFIYSDTFKTHVEDFLNNNDLRQIDGVWSYLEEMIGFHSLYHYSILQYYLQKLGIDFTDEKSIKEGEKIVKKVSTGLRFALEYDRLGFHLLKKLTCFDPLAEFHSHYFKKTIQNVEKVNAEIRKKRQQSKVIK